MSVTVQSTVVHVKEMTKQAMEVAGEKIGGIFEGHAKELCPVKTGLLRNSIVHGLGGKGITKVYTSDPVNAQGEFHGTTTGKISGTLPPEQDSNKVTVYVGTNVEYAPYVELGHHQQPGRYVPAIGKRLKASYVAGKPFLAPAVTGCMDEVAQALNLELGSVQG